MAKFVFALAVLFVLALGCVSAQNAPNANATAPTAAPSQAPAAPAAPTEAPQPTSAPAPQIKGNTTVIESILRGHPVEKDDDAESYMQRVQQIFGITQFSEADKEVIRRAVKDKEARLVRTRKFKRWQQWKRQLNKVKKLRYKYQQKVANIKRKNLQIRQKREEISDKAEAIELNKEKLSNQRAAVNAKRATVAELRTELNDIRTRIRLMRETLKQKIQHLKNQANEIKQRKATVTEKDELIKYKDDKIVALKRRIRALNAEVATREQLLNNENNKLRGVERHLTKRTNKLNNDRAELNDAIAKIKNTNDQSDEEAKHLQTLRNHVAELRRQIGVEVQRIGDLKNALAQLRVDLNERQQRISAQDTEIQTRQARTRQLDSDIDTNTERIAAVTRDLTARQQAIAQKQRELDDKRTTIRRKDVEVQNATQRVPTLDQDLEKKKIEAAAIGAKIKDTQKEYETVLQQHAEHVHKKSFLAGRWTDYLEGYRPSQWRRVGRLCVVSGLILNGDFNLFGILPAKCRPEGVLIFGLDNHEHLTRVHVNPTGEVRYVTGAANHRWLSLDGIAFSVGNGGAPLSLSSGWTNWGEGYRAAAIDVEGDLCTLSGVLRGDWGAFEPHLPLTVLPENCRPTERLIFMAPNDWTANRIDVIPDGRVLWIHNWQRPGWTTLSHIMFRTGTGGAHVDQFHYGTGNFLSSYRPLRYKVENKLCVVSGLINSGWFHNWHPFATLPSDCRPSGRLIFGLFKHGHVARVDVDTGGNIIFGVSNGGNSYWISIDGLKFVVN